MSNGNEMMMLGSSAQDFLTRSEKRVGAFGMVAIAAVLGVVAYKVLPFINRFLDLAISATFKGFALAGLGVVAVFIGMMLFDKRTWTNIWHIQHSFTRMISTALMKYDPFGRMRAFANEYLGEKWEKFNNASITLEDQKLQKADRIKKMEESLAEANSIVKNLEARHFRDGVWDSDENHNLFRQTSMKITFTENSLIKLRKDLVKLTLLVKIVDKWRNSFKFEIETTRMTADFLEEDFKQADATAGALEAASSAFGGGDMAVADKEVRSYIEKLTSGRIARAEVLMKQIPELTAIGDLKGDIAEDEIMKRLREFDVVADQAMDEIQRDRLLLTSGKPDQIAEAMKVPEKVTVPARRYLK